MNGKKLLGRRRELVLFLLSIFLSFLLPHAAAQREQNPMTMNGGSVLAMAGRDCVCLAMDKRFGLGNALVNVAPRPVLLASDAAIVAFTGLQGHVQSLQTELAAQVRSKFARGLGYGGAQQQQKQISVTAMASLTSHVLYRQKAYYVEPVVVGLEAVVATDDEGLKGDDNNGETGEGTTESRKTVPQRRRLCYRPYLCSMDMIGAISTSKTFVCAGAAKQSLYGTAEALWRPDLSQDELVQTTAKAFLTAIERDCLSGYGAMLYLITSAGNVVEYDLDSRID
jgi:20S proteasome subunit beta 3